MNDNGFTGRQPNLLAHQIDRRDHFRHGVLDLNARLDLGEAEMSVQIAHELDRADAAKTDQACNLQRRLPDLLTLRGRQAGRGRFFDHLLIAANQRAFALAQMHHLPR